MVKNPPSNERDTSSVSAWGTKSSYARGQTNTHAAMKTQSSQKKNHQKQSAKGHIQNDTFVQERRGNKII